MKNPISQIDKKITQLKLKKEKLQTNLAKTFIKRAQKILGDDDFSTDLVLTVLSQAWNTASNKQKEEWKVSSISFRKPRRRARKKTYKTSSTTFES